MPGPIFRVVDCADGAAWWTQDFDTIERFEAFASGAGWTRTGVQAQRDSDLPPLRPQLIGHPTYRESAGPSWDGEENGRPVIRYETWAAYRWLSE